MLSDHISSALENAKWKSRHGRHIKALKNAYRGTQSDHFLFVFTLMLVKLFKMKQPKRDSRYANTIDFATKFGVEIARSENVLPDSFFNKLVHAVLQCRKYEYMYNGACQFLIYLLRNLKCDINLMASEFFNEIIEVLLQCLRESNNCFLRFETVIALANYQKAPQCPIIETFLARLYSDNSIVVRREILRLIAVTDQTIHHIKEHVLDVNAIVRYTAFTRCGDMGPNKFRPEDRYMIVTAGCIEREQAVRCVVFGHMLPKWMDFYRKRFNYSKTNGNTRGL